MITRKQIFLVALIAFMPVTVSMAAPVIEEGVFLEEAEGLVTLDTETDTWQFVPFEGVELTAGQTYPAGQAAAMLPCAVLEQMAKLAGEENELRVRLWAVFTEYHGENGLFSVYFLPIGEKATPVETPTEQPPAEETPQEKPAAQKQTDSIIPENILKEIRSTETPDLKKFEQIAVVTGDTNLIGRTGYLEQRNGQRIFHPDGFGRNVNDRAFVLLPNKMRADAEAGLGHTPGQQRYTVSGLVTTYKGQTYMLLRRAQRTFSNGNFTP